MKNTLIALAVMVGAYVYIQNRPNVAAHVPLPGLQGKFEDQLDQAMRHEISNIQVMGEGVVVELIPSNPVENMQKFTLELNTGDTLTVRHNLAQAYEIRALQVGDKVEFFGEMDWTSKGAVVHYTHDDPEEVHIDGWLKHLGATYQ